MAAKKRTGSVNFEKANEVVDSIKNGVGSLNYDSIKAAEKALKDIEDQIVVLAQKEYSDAFFAYYDLKNPLKCFNVYDAKGTLIAYAWLNEEDGIPVFAPNNQSYEKRMN